MNEITSNLHCPHCKNILDEYQIASSKNCSGIYYTLHCNNCGAFCPTYYDYSRASERSPIPTIAEFIIPKIAKLNVTH